MRIFNGLLAGLTTLLVASAATAQDSKDARRYPRSLGSEQQEGVPRGKVTDHELLESSVFPGTVRRYSVYVPAQYDAAKPAALMASIS